MRTAPWCAGIVPHCGYPEGVLAPDAERPEERAGRRLAGWQTENGPDILPARPWAARNLSAVSRAVAGEERTPSPLTPNPLPPNG